VAGLSAVTAISLLAVAIGAPIAALRIAGERANAEQRLYDSLVSEAHAKRQARQVGYRDEVFVLLQRANSLNVPNKDLAVLRQEAAQCLGDFVGLTPTVFDDISTNASIWMTQIDPAGRLAAFVLDDATIVLRHFPGGETVARLRRDKELRGLSFGPGGDQLVSVHQPNWSGDLNERLASAQVCIWTRDSEGRWPENAEKFALPGAFASLSVGTNHCVAVNNWAAHSVELREAKTHRLVRAVEYFPENQIERIAVSPDQRFVALAGVSAGDLQALEVRELVTRKIVGRSEEKQGWNASLAFSGDSQHVAWFTSRGGRIYATEPWRVKYEFLDYFEI
jgi:hypothetical protein